MKIKIMVQKNSIEKKKILNLNIMAFSSTYKYFIYYLLFSWNYNKLLTIKKFIYSFKSSLKCTDYIYIIWKCYDYIFILTISFTITFLL